MIKETLEKNKIYIVIVIILLLYLGITYTLYKDNKNKEKNNDYIVTNNSKYVYEEGKLKTIENQNEYNWKDYNIYIDNVYLGNYKLQYNNKWYIYNDQHDPIKYEGNVIASTNDKIKVFEFNRQNISLEEMGKINSYLESKDITIVDYNIYESKIECDIDNDETKENIYRINSKINGNSDNIFSIILLEKNNKFTEITSKIIKKEDLGSSNIKLYDVYGFIDIDSDNTLEILITEIEYSQPDNTKEYVYKYSNSKYQKIEVEKSK